jgi:succinoglycan biosynthesis protein ExoM
MFPADRRFMSLGSSSVDQEPTAFKASEEKPAEHITVCICTYKRPNMLRSLLPAVEAQRTEGMFTLSLVIVDNDAKESARPVAESFALASTIEVDYEVEPEQNIALARNRAIDLAKGEYVALIDDDEFPEADWIFRLYSACKLYNADGVLGPVLPHYEVQPPKWVIKGKLFERPSHRTGDKLDWVNTRTGNVLLRRCLFFPPQNRFNPLYSSGGEDRDLFRRLIVQGRRFFWSQEAPVHETIPSTRWNRSFMFQRALLRGQVSMVDPRRKVARVIISLGAVLVYIILLPFLFLVATHLGMTYLIKIGDHFGRLLAAVGIRVIKLKYLM